MMYKHCVQYITCCKFFVQSCVNFFFMIKHVYYEILVYYAKYMVGFGHDSPHFFHSLEFSEALVIPALGKRW